MRDFLRTGENALLILLIMLTGSLVLWIGLPVGWLWVASQVTAATDSLGAGLGVTLFGLPISVVVMAQLLTWLSNKHRQLRVDRGQEDIGHFVLEVVMVISATVATVGFAAWFFLFSGSSPFPLHIGL